MRQLLKFQLPSPYHRPGNNSAAFHVRPYLELIRLIRTLGTLRFDELMLFGLQLTDRRHFDETVSSIDIFRAGQALNKGRYKRYLKSVLDAELATIYAEDLAS